MEELCIQLETAATRRVCDNTCTSRDYFHVMVYITVSLDTADKQCDQTTRVVSATEKNAISISSIGLFQNV